MRTEAGSCPLCGSADSLVFLELAEMPVHCNRLWPSRQTAQAAPRGELRLAFCPACTHLFNAGFCAERMEYGGDYDNSLHFSPHFRDFSRTLADYLIERYQLRDRCILEIGCGKGEFLSLLTTLGDNLGIGFDPSFEPGRVAADEAARMQIVPDQFSPGRVGVEADFVCCRHVLEHLADPVDFLARLRMLARRRPVPVFFEVPNGLATLRDLGVWDLIYEHPSYFSPASLGRLFGRAGFSGVAVREAFAGQFLWLEAVALPDPSPAGQDGPEAETAEVAALVERFRERFEGRIAAWRETLAGLRRHGQRAVIWGAGSKGVTFLNLLPAGEEIVGAVDLNPHKHGKYLPGSGLPVFPPEALPAQAPDLVIVMNPVYRREIERHLEKLGSFAEVRTV